MTCTKIVTVKIVFRDGKTDQFSCLKRDIIGHAIGRNQAQAACDIIDVIDVVN